MHVPLFVPLFFVQLLCVAWSIPSGQVLYLQGNGHAQLGNVVDLPSGSQNRSVTFWFSLRVNNTNTTMDAASLVTWGAFNPTCTEDFTVSLGWGASPVLSTAASAAWIETGGICFNQRNISIFSNNPSQWASWNHVAVTYRTSVLRTYINGVLYQTRSISYNTSAGPVTLTVGGQPNTQLKNVQGFLDDVKIYDQELSQSQISDDMYNLYTARAPVVWYTMDLANQSLQAISTTTNSLDLPILQSVAFASAVFVQQVSVADGTPAHLTTGQTVTIWVQYNANVSVGNPGVPQLLLQVGTGRVGVATLSGGSGTSTLTFVYTIQSADSISVLSYVNTTSLRGGEEITSLAFPALQAVSVLPLNSSGQALAASSIAINRFDSTSLLSCSNSLASSTDARFTCTFTPRLNSAVVTIPFRLLTPQLTLPSFNLTTPSTNFSSSSFSLNITGPVGVSANLTLSPRVSAFTLLASLPDQTSTFSCPLPYLYVRSTLVCRLTPRVASQARLLHGSAITPSYAAPLVSDVTLSWSSTAVYASFFDVTVSGGSQTGPLVLGVTLPGGLVLSANVTVIGKPDLSSVMVTSYCG